MPWPAAQRQSSVDPRSTKMVGLDRFELSTSRLSSARSNQLSYRPEKRASIRRKRNEGGGNPALELRSRSKSRGKPRDWFGIVPGVPRQNRWGRLSPGTEVHDPQGLFLRKEVIQPQVPLRLPCYDFTPVADLTVVGCLLAVSAPASGKTNSHGVTGGVYKARERIHRGVLIRDY